MARTRGYSIVFKGLTGLNNIIQPMRAPYDRELGIQAVTASENIIFDNSMAARLRPGLFELDDLPWSCLFANETCMIGVRGGSLFRIEPGIETVLTFPIASGFTQRIDYTNVNDAIYFVSGEKNGRIIEGIHFPWNATGGYGRDTDRVFSGPPVADHIAFHLARIWLGTKNGIVFSEPLGFGLFDLHRSSIPTDAPVTMMCAVKDGLFVSTTKKVYFLAGNEPNNFQLVEKDAAPAKEWSLLSGLVDARALGLDFSGEVALWIGADGVYAGLPDGNVANLTFENVKFQETLPFGASIVFEDQFMFCLGA